MPDIKKRVSELEMILGEYMAQNALAARRSEAEMREFKTEMTAFKDEMNKKWGDLANKLGTIIEDIVAPNIPTIAKKYFGIDDYDRMMVNPYVRNSKDRSKRKEFDVVLVSGDAVLLNETKMTVRQEHLENFAKSLPEFFAYFPEFAGRKLIPVFLSLSFREEQIRFLSKAGIYAMAMTGSTMDILNFSEVEKIVE
ncbi:hypothetical protein Ctha_2296 [Chloroherpeton thalassium ATCC 35110]|uniref:Uncharacterized protein n=1 Tax=Chloroherpeton thalassium (strain ATCC 35110 / GB-78) TaxID=517418 RepID=B3QWI7_CHLT3|nr:hypothetical protein [Chloroherpeton thalassium]ACF14747.1 hypothetical protein Ctha_2296 [Chloroherpeton thalassium ATCC 35110]